LLLHLVIDDLFTSFFFSRCKRERV